MACNSGSMNRRSDLTAAERESAAELARLEDETRKLMRNLGFNLMLLDRDEHDIDQFKRDGLPTVDMPEEFVDRLAADKRLTMVTHLVATLRGTTRVGGATCTSSAICPR